jgi:hypothetical protein
VGIQYVSIHFLACLFTEQFSVLDPRIMFSGLKHRFGHQFDLAVGLDDIKKEFGYHFLDNYIPDAPAAASQPSSATPGLLRRSETLDFLGESAPPRASDAPRRELEQFLALEPEAMDCDPVRWWASRTAQFPHMSKFAKDILSIPGECVWSSHMRNLG